MRQWKRLTIAWLVLAALAVPADAQTYPTGRCG